MTLLEIKAVAAAYHEKTPAELIQNGVDLGLVALNQAKRQAELVHDFGFQRKLLTVIVNTVTGGSLDNAKVQGSSVPATIKTVLDLGQFDNIGNFIPAEWTTVDEGQERQREENRNIGYRYPTDAQYRASLCGQSRLTLRGNDIMLWPLGAVGTAQNLTIGIDAYVFDEDWVDITRLTITGASTPNVNGTYTRDGEAFGFPVFFSDTSSFFLYYDGVQWIITSNPTDAENSFSLIRDGNSPNGTLTANGTYIGTVTVTASSATITGLNTSIWTRYAAQYLQWQTVIELNKLFKTFVGRQEGNVAEPQALADAGLQAFIDWDIFRYEQSRRHGR